MDWGKWPQKNSNVLCPGTIAVHKHPYLGEQLICPVCSVTQLGQCFLYTWPLSMALYCTCFRWKGTALPWVLGEQGDSYQSCHAKQSSWVQNRNPQAELLVKSSPLLNHSTPCLQVKGSPCTSCSYHPCMKHLGCASTERCLQIRSIFLRLHWPHKTLQETSIPWSTLAWQCN